MRVFLGGFGFRYTGYDDGRLGRRFACSWLLLRSSLTCHRTLGLLFSIRSVWLNGARTAAVGLCRRTSAAERRPELRAVKVRFLNYVCVGFSGIVM